MQMCTVVCHGKSISVLNFSLSAKIYTVSVRVGEVVNSQTSLYIQLFGENGETSKIMLRPAGPSLTKFESGRTYKFTVETVDIGKVYMSTL